MFFECENLIFLDLSNFDIKNVQEKEKMFKYCDKLIFIKVNHKFYKKIKEEAYIYPPIEKFHI